MSRKKYPHQLSDRHSRMLLAGIQFSAVFAGFPFAGMTIKIQFWMTIYCLAPDQRAP
jgi:hypothetical protein